LVHAKPADVTKFISDRLESTTTQLKELDVLLLKFLSIFVAKSGYLDEKSAAELKAVMGTEMGHRARTIQVVPFIGERSDLVLQSRFPLPMVRRATLSILRP